MVEPLKSGDTEIRWPENDDNLEWRGRRGVPLPAMLTSQGWLVRLHDPKEGVPYGFALAAAGLLVYPETPFMAALGS